MVLHPRRWLLGLVTVPYIAIPLYLVLGERKLRHARHRRMPAEDPGDPPATVAWLDTPERARAAFLDGIRAARRTIHISTFILGDDPVGHELVRALTARARDGVAVRLLIDGLWAHRAPRRELAELRRAGGEVRVFLPLLQLPWHGRSNVRNHRKVALFDDARAIVGGMNLAAEYLASAPDTWCDLSIELTGGPVRTLAALFSDDWVLAGGEPLVPAPPPAPGPPHSGARAGSVAIIPAGPDCENDPWRDALVELIAGARQRLWIATPYFAPDDELVRALERAAARGVDVAIVVPARSNHWVADRVAAPLLRALVRAGVSVHRYLPAMMHAKAIAIDDDVAAVGTANFDMRSLFLDFEVTALLCGREHNRRLRGWFEHVMARSATGSLPRPAAVDRAAELVTRLVAPIV